MCAATARPFLFKYCLIFSICLINESFGCPAELRRISFILCVTRSSFSTVSVVLVIFTAVETELLLLFFHPSQNKPKDLLHRFEMALPPVWIISLHSSSCWSLSDGLFSCWGEWAVEESGNLISEKRLPIYSIQTQRFNSRSSSKMPKAGLWKPSR